MFMSGKPFIIAHRGSRPENTMQAFAHARRIGCKVFECDVRLSKDLVPVVIHDKKVDRTTEGKGRVNGKTAAELVALGVHRLSDLAVFIRDDPTLALVIELKDLKWWWKNQRLVDSVVTVVEEHGVTNRCMFISFRKQILKYLKEVSDVNTLDLHIGYLYGPFKGRSDPVLVASKYAIDSLWLHHSLIDETVKNQCRVKGLELFTWTVNEENDMERVTRNDLQISGVVTDYPELWV